MQSVLPISAVDSPGIPLQGLTEKSGRLQLLLDIRAAAMSSLTFLCSALYPKPSLAVEASLVSCNGLESQRLVVSGEIPKQGPRNESVHKSDSPLGIGPNGGTL